MIKTTERKVFLGLFLLAGAALFIDKGLLSPEGASADSIPIAADTISGTAPIPGNVLSSKPATAVLIDRLHSKASSDTKGSLASIFSLSMMVGSEDSAQRGDQEPTSHPEDTQESFPTIAPAPVNLPTLSSVMPTHAGGEAVLGSKLMRIGERNEDGFTLIQVHARSCVVQRDGVQYTIRMPKILGQD